MVWMCACPTCCLPSSRAAPFPAVQLPGSMRLAPSSFRVSVRCVEVPGGVAVLAENTWAAMQGRAALNVTWTPGANVVFSSGTIRQQMIEVVQKAIAEEDKKSFTTIEATFETPYLAHARDGAAVLRG